MGAVRCICLQILVCYYCSKEITKSPTSTSPTSFYDTVAPNISVSPGPATHDELFPQHGTKSPSVIYDTNDDGKASPIHAEIKLLVRTSDNGRESVEIRSLKEVVVPPAPTSPIPPPVSIGSSASSPLPRPTSSCSSVSPSNPQALQKGTLSPTPTSDSTKIYEDPSSEERVESPILTQKLVVRFQEGDQLN